MNDYTTALIEVRDKSTSVRKKTQVFCGRKETFYEVVDSTGATIVAASESLVKAMRRSRKKDEIHYRLIRANP